ncbi:MAG: fibronectin type protein [Solirubrobacterales bacterium]|nr:fibronectin type protein [Solirubrobacterales bacterium]
MSLLHRSSVVALLAALCAVLALTPAAALAVGPPAATSGAATDLTPTTAKLAGTVNPNGLPTTVAFDYGTSTAYGSSTSIQDVGTGTAAVDVVAAVSGLKAGTSYHYRLSASNSGGTDAGADRTFTTPAAPLKPSVASQAATAVSTGSATVGAAVNPNGQSTQIVFDYGTTTAYGASTGAQNAGEGTVAVTIKATLKSLAPNTTYHYRARATNATGTTNGADRTFKTGSFSKPGVATGAVADLTATSATITGKVDPNGRGTQVVAQIGQTTAYGSQTAAISAGLGGSAVTVRLPVAGLQPSRTYHYRLVATSDAGTTNGTDRTFKTPRTPNTLTLTATGSRVTYGQATTLTALLGGSGNGGVALNLFAAPFPFAGGYTTFAPGIRADSAGRASTQITPRRTTRYRGTALVAGLTISSPTLRVTVVPSVTVRVARRPGGRVRLTGVIRPRGNATVSLRRILPDGRAVTIKRGRARPVAGGVFSRYTLTLKTTPGRYRVHVKPDSRGLAAGDSPVVTVRR